jgi:adenosine deaminase
VTLNTDDPGYLGIDLTGEFELASGALGWSIDETVERVRTAIDASFCGQERCAELHRELDEFVAQHLDASLDRRATT